MNEAEMRRLEAQLQSIKAERQVWLIWTGRIFRFVVILGLAFVVAYNMPTIGSVPFAQLTLNDLLVTAACGGFALWCLKWAFDGPTDEAAEAWGGFAILIIIAVIGLAFYLTR